MKKVYSSPDFEVIKVEIADVLLGSPTETIPETFASSGTEETTFDF